MVELHVIETIMNLFIKKNEKTPLRKVCRGLVGVFGPGTVGGASGPSKRKSKDNGVDYPKCSWVLHASR